VIAVAILAKAGVVVGVIAVIGYLNGPDAASTTDQGCRVSDAPAGGIAGYDPGQVGNAATIVAIGKRMGVPERGWVVAVATAMQESGLRNLDHGDRDSRGLFQQRPSQGWGTPAQVMTPSYAATQFYRHLLAVPGWQRMRVTDAAQAVQRSGFPGAYARHEHAAGQVVAGVSSAACS
jgi:hypothetical protein